MALAASIVLLTHSLHTLFSLTLLFILPIIFHSFRKVILIYYSVIKTITTLRKNFGLHLRIGFYFSKWNCKSTFLKVFSYKYMFFASIDQCNNQLIIQRRACLFKSLPNIFVYTKLPTYVHYINLYLTISNFK